MIDSITFNTADSKLIVTYEDGSTAEYTESTKDQYIKDHPDRSEDIIAMRW